MWGYPVLYHLLSLANKYLEALHALTRALTRAFTRALTGAYSFGCENPPGFWMFPGTATPSNIKELQAESRKDQRCSGREHDA